MKTKLIFGSFLALASMSNAQTNTFPGTGNAGIGTTTPGNKLEIVTTAASDGIRIRQTSVGAAGLTLDNQTTGGKSWSIFSLGNGDAAGAGNLSIFHNVTSFSGNHRLFINGTSGNIGIGNTNPSNGKLQVNTLSDGSGVNTAGYFIANANSSSGSADYYGVIGRSNSTNGLGQWQVGVAGEASTTGEQCGGQNMGFRGVAEGAVSNIGGLFIGGGVPFPGTCCTTNIGVWGTYGSYCSTSWAGYFNGDVGTTGSFITVSDRKFKKEIKPLENTMQKIMLLRPTTYTYKNEEEFKDLNLPQGNQIGLIAQELEEVFPELIKNVAEINVDDKNKKIHSPAFKGVQYLPLISVMIAGIQEQQHQIESLKQELASLRTEGTTGINEINTVETGFQMSQNEPNPFTHETVVKYTLPTTISNAFMAVYDLTGKQITTFPINERGSASVVLTSDKLSAGIYIYSIVADGKVVDSKRMIVAEK